MEKTYKILKLVFLVLALVVLILGAGRLYNSLGGSRIGQLATEATQPPEAQSQPQETHAPKTTPAPDFTVYDLEGNAHKLSDFKGKPVVLNFWASWCGPCQSEMPAFEEKYLEYGEKVHFLMVNLTDGRGETVESASGFIKGMKYTFPVYYDTAVEAARAYGVNSVPVTYFADAQGNLVTYARGAISADVLQQGIEMIS
jgi:thiol-disulfide isomerase/thioredoxin